MKHAANLITGLRMLLSLALAFLTPLSPAFYACYALCGLSDLVDGPVARKTGTADARGAALDSAADAMLALVMLMRFLPLTPLPCRSVVWISAIAALRLAALAVGYAKYRALLPLHTLANKAVGFMLFLFPFLYGFISTAAAVNALCAAASLASAEELLLQILSKTPDQNVKSVFSRH